MLILRNFRKQMEDIINNSQLPIDAIYYVLKDVYNEVTEVYSQEITKEKNEDKVIEDEKEKNEE